MTRVRRVKNRIAKAVVWGIGFAFVLGGIALLAYTLWRGVQGFTTELFLTQRDPLRSTNGILPNIVNTLYILFFSIVMALPIGVFGGIFIGTHIHTRLGSVARALVDSVACVPPVVYGFVGLSLFGSWFGLGQSLHLGVLCMVMWLTPVTAMWAATVVRKIPRARRLQAGALGANHTALVNTLVLPEGMEKLVMTAFVSLTAVLGESALLLLAAGTGAELAGSFFAQYSHEGATLAVALYTSVQHLGDYEMAFSIAAVLVLLNLLLTALGQRVERGFHQIFV